MSRSTLYNHKQGKCPKCDSPNIAIKYCNRYFNLLMDCFRSDIGLREHFHKKCKTCNYKWLELLTKESQ